MFVENNFPREKMIVYGLRQDECGVALPNSHARSPSGYDDEIYPALTDLNLRT